MQKIITVLGLPAAGKEQPNSELVLTPLGFVPMGSIKINDYVIDSKGFPTKVLGVYPQGLKEVYEVLFQDGTSVKCGLDHLWTVEYTSHGKNKKETLPLSILLNKTLLYRGNRSKYKTPLYQPKNQDGIVLENAWVIGYSLGNGCFKHSQFSISCHADNLQLVKKEFDKAFNCSGKTRFTSKLGCCINYPWHKAPIKLQKYRAQGIKQYINESVLILCSESKKQLLAGLIDSDGHCSKDNSLSFANTSAYLIDTVINLTRSLGGKATQSQKPDNRKGSTVRLSLLDIPLKIKEYKIPNKSKLVAGIVSINKLNYKEESTCIMIAAPDCLYVTNGFKLTHNTTFVNSKINNAASARFEPTDDMALLIKQLTTKKISNLVLDRMLLIDAAFQMQSTHYRDSDYYTSKIIFGGKSNFSEYIAPQSTELVYLKINPKLQKERILARNRPFAEQELMYCKKEWHQKVEEAFYLHPAAIKSVIIQ